MKTVTHYREKGFPLEAVYLDQKHMNKFRSFALDRSMITNATELKEDLKAFKIKLVAFVDSTIYAPDDVTLEKSKNPAYVEGNSSGIFIKSSHFSSTNYSGNLVAVRSLQKCVYVDWFQPNVYSYWFKNLQNYHREVDFDGVWTTNNEAYTDIQGEINMDALNKATTHNLQAGGLGESQYDTNWFTSFNSSSNSTYNLPFIPEFTTKGSYDANSISLNATHKGYQFYNSRTKKWENRTETEYNLHSLYGHAMIEITHRALTDLSNFNTTLRDKRQFVVTRSTFTGTNQFASYPIRSRHRTWESLRNSIPHVMSMNMFGFTHSGADACGTLDIANSNRTEVDEELCLRWIQLATFFPLARHSQNFKTNNSH